jgi:hypothetical protein
LDLGDAPVSEWLHSLYLQFRPTRIDTRRRSVDRLRAHRECARPKGHGEAPW